MTIASYPEYLRLVPKKPFACVEVGPLVPAPIVTTVRPLEPQAGSPAMGPGSSALVVFDAMNPGLTSNGLRLRCALKRASDTPDCTSPLSMPTSLVVQMSLDGPRMIAPVSRSPRQRSFR